MTVKVLMISHKIPPAVGGVEAIVDTQARGLVEEHGFDVKVALLARGPLNPEYPYGVIRLPSKSQLLSLAKEADVVICHVYIIKLLWLRLLSQRPWIKVVHGWQKDPTSPANPWHPHNRAKGFQGFVQDVKGLLTVAGERWGGTVVTAPSADVARETGSVAKIIPNGYRDDIFRVVKAPAERDPKSVVAMGRFSPEKGFDVLLKAVAIAKEAGTELHLTLVGDGPLTSYLQKLTQELGIDDQVEFCGRQAPEAVNSILNDNAILAMPSTAREAFGLVLIEGAAAGCTVVASDVGAVSEVLAGTGHLVAPNDPEALAACLISVADGRPPSSEQSRTSIENAARYTNKLMTARYADLIAQVTQKTKKAQPR